MRHFRIRQCAITALMVLVFQSLAYGEIVTVLGDVNALDRFTLGNAGNQQFARNLLGDGVSVLRSAQNTGEWGRGLTDFYAGLDGVESLTSSEELTPATLNEVDLLIIDVGFSQFNPYSASETATIRNFLRTTGDVVIMLEHNPTTFPSANELLAGIGTEIQLLQDRGGGGEYRSADEIIETPLTVGVDDFLFAFSHDVAGGIPTIRHRGRTIVAYESISAVPEPRTVLSLLLIAGLAMVRTRQRSTG